MGILFDEQNRLFVLETAHTTYEMKIDEIGVVEHLYYGAKIDNTDMSYLIQDCDRGFSGNPYELRNRRGFSLDTRPLEYSGTGIGDYRISAISVHCENGMHSVDLRYKSHKIMKGKYVLEGLPYVRENGADPESLILTLEDKETGIEADLYYGVFDDKDVITRSAVLRNVSDKKIIIDKIASTCVDFPYGQYDVVHFYGRHNMERNMERTPVTNNIQVIASNRGMTSHQHNPFVILCEKDATEKMGDAYGCMLMYSGNHRTEVEMDQTGGVRIVSGINSENFRWDLEVGGSFTAPESILSYSKDGFNGLSHNYHDIIRENVCDPKYMDIQRPVLINNWEATYFDFDRDKIISLAKEAKALGIEMLVLDDGWFGERNSDNSGLGDWYVNEAKLKETMPQLVKEIHDIGLKFGLWFEPEMINEDSDLYRSHPDWAIREPQRKPVMGRNQLVLDMSRKEVVDYLFDRINEIVSTSKLEYVKWDFNRCIANSFSVGLDAQNQGELGHRFILGTYSLLSRLLQANPDLMIEGCAGGGGRFDAGMMFYCPQIWCSDDTDAVERLQIQKGTSYGYPVSTVGSHVSAAPNHQTLRTTPLHTRGVVAMSGTFGYELDITKLPDTEKEEIKEQIRTFHKYYWLIQKGDYYRLSDEKTENYFTAWEFVSKDRAEALVNMVVTHVQANAAFPFVKFMGLDPKTIYVERSTGYKYSGAALMNGGYVFTCVHGNYPAIQLHFVAEDNLK